MTKIMELAVYGVVILVSLSVCQADNADQNLPNRTTFMCLGTQICNRDTWQYCDVDDYERCRHCSDVGRFCWTQQMPFNCSIYCLEQQIEKRRVKGCPPLEATSNGQHNGSSIGTRHGDVIIVQCNAGYQSVGPSSVKCLDHGHYSGSFLCQENLQRKDCPPLELPSHGRHNGTLNGTRHGDVIVVQCNAGYQPVGPSSIKCLDYGYYSGSFLCIEKKPTALPPGEEKTYNIPLIIVSIIGGCGWVLFIATGLWACISRQTQNDKKKSPEKRSPETLPLVNSEEPDRDTRITIDPAVTPTGDETRIDGDDGSRQRPRQLMTQRSRSETDPNTLSRRDESLNGDLGRSSIPDVSPRGASGGRSSPPTMAASEESKDSGINLSQGITININNNVCAHTNDENEENKDNPDNATEQTPTNPPPKPTIIEKFSTEETGSTSKPCRGELDDEPEMSDGGDVEDIATERKETFDNKNPGSSLFIHAVEEQKKDHIPQKAHVQAMKGEKHTDKIAIGTQDVGKSDVLL